MMPFLTLITPILHLKTDIACTVSILRYVEIQWPFTVTIQSNSAILDIYTISGVFGLTKPFYSTIIL